MTNLSIQKILNDLEKMKFEYELITNRQTKLLEVHFTKRYQISIYSNYFKLLTIHDGNVYHLEYWFKKPIVSIELTPKKTILKLKGNN